MTKLKICGLRPDDDLTFTESPWVSFVGVVFVPASKRFVPPQEARRIVERVSDRCAVLGVFVDCPEDELLSTAQVSGIHGFQLHGAEPPALCARLKARGFTVWKALPVDVAHPDDPDALERLVHTAAAFCGSVDALLFDAAPPKGAPAGMTGGHGRPFAWTVLPKIAARLAECTDAVPPLWVAGGLRAENIPALLEVFRPQGVDLSSGAEENGRKSPEKIRQIIEVVSHCGAT